MCKVKISCLVVLVAFFVVQMANGQIHRASSQSMYQVKYDSNFTMNYFVKKLHHLSTQSGNNSSSLLKQSDASPLLSSIFLVNYVNYMNDLNHEKIFVWMTSVMGTFVVGICGILPVFLLPQLIHDHQKLVNTSLFKCLISFAAGSLLGDVFLHLLPETYAKSADQEKMISNGLWTLCGLLTFFTIEKLFGDSSEEESNKEEDSSKATSTKKSRKSKNKKGSKKSKVPYVTIKVLGILNLVANVIDNFTHGIAVAGSFQASFKFGLMTLMATLLHEIPHEIGDFVILLKSGLNYKQAAVAQLLTALAGIIGAMFALAYSTAEKAGDVTCWILPFTSGAFLYIALANILPDLLNDKDNKQSIKQICSVYFGVAVIYVIKLMFD